LTQQTGRVSKHSLLPGIELIHVLGIRASILEGDIDKALKHTNAYYPNVLVTNPQIVFRLKCRKWVELIRKSSDLQSQTSERQSKVSNGHSKTAVEDVFDQNMELDEQHEDWDKMETEEAEVAMKYQELMSQAMEYGQVLMQEYRDEKREYSDKLREIFSLMAYDDPKISVHGHLIDPSGRVVVAEELNSAILGKRNIHYVIDENPNTSSVTWPCILRRSRASLSSNRCINQRDQSGRRTCRLRQPPVTVQSIGITSPELRRMIRGGWNNFRAWESMHLHSVLRKRSKARQGGLYWRPALS
jgi:CTLH/CRA C-terminal to LisH motif domain